ncbi:MAG: ShlB/FhaC/HecB family hemolysin secretion/activation protein, partial [Pseudomonadota bacterium]
EALVAEGYVSSGFRLREVDLQAGSATYELIEGRLVDVLVRGDGVADGARGIGELDPAYVAARLAPEPGAFDVDATQEALRVLLRDRNIERVDAAIRPGAAPGEAVLDVDATARRPYDFAFTFANDTPAEIGEATGRVAFAARNIAAAGDELRGEAELTEGRRRIVAEFETPTRPGGPAPFVAVEAARSEFVSGPLSDPIDARSDFLRFAAGVRLPLIETSRRSLTTVVAFDWKRTKSFAGGIGVTFGSGSEGGVTRTSVLSLGQEFVDLGEDRTIAIRATANLGLPILGATPNTAENPSGQDGEFFSFIAQAQAAQRLTPEVTLIARAQGQLASEALLPVEQVAIGGRETVRGFPEAAANGDDALVGSLEGRIAAFDLPVPDLTPAGHDATFVLTPFVDAGVVRRREGGGSDTLVGVGGGFIWSPRPGLSARFFFGAPLTDRRGARGLQGEGAHFAVTLALP